MNLICVQARMGATRLPGKPLLKVLGRPLLSYLLERLQRVRGDVAVVLLTTTAPRDSCLVDLAAAMGVAVFRGSEGDVLERFAVAAQQLSPSVIVRVTADCPLLDSAIIERCLAAYHAIPGRYDYLSNVLERTFPRGMDVEVFSYHSLMAAYASAREPYEREHVTPYLYGHPELFSLGQVTFPCNLSHWRWTVDTIEDFAVVAPLLAAAYSRTPTFTFEDLVTIAKKHPEWMSLNCHIEQKPLFH